MGNSMGIRWEFEGIRCWFRGIRCFQYACGAMNPSTGAMRGRGKVSFYKIKRGNRLAPAPGPGVWFLLRATLARGL